MIVVEEVSEVQLEASFIRYDEIVQTLAANGSDDSLHICTLPG